MEASLEPKPASIAAPAPSGSARAAARASMRAAAAGEQKIIWRSSTPTSCERSETTRTPPGLYELTTRDGSRESLACAWSDAEAAGFPLLTT